MNPNLTELTTKPYITLSATTTLASTTTAISTTLAPSVSFSIQFCPGTAKTIDCSASGDFVYIMDAFYGVSDQVPVNCTY